MTPEPTEREPPREAGIAPGALSRLLLRLVREPADELATSSRRALAPGERVGRFEVLRQIGRGGFGAVYEAADEELGRRVALKTLRPGRGRAEVNEGWIQREAEAVARLDHPSIVTLFDVGSCDSGAYLVMELLRGETLAGRLERGPLPLDDALRVAEAMAAALAHAHERGVLHRDLKPSNVFLTEDGRAKLLDFGLAHLLGTEASSGGGTPGYMAPEQARGDAVDSRADVYAAAMVLREMLTGERPDAVVAAVEGSEQAAAAPCPARLTAEVPRPLAHAVRRALSPAADARPRDGRAWLAELVAARAAFERPRRIRRIALLAGAGIALGVLASGVATWRVWRRQFPPGVVTVAVAGFANDAGDRELDGLGALLTTSLQQSTGLRVLSQARLREHLRQLGRGEVERLDEALARELGLRGGIDVVLLASVRKLDDKYVLETRALDPARDEYVFSLREAARGKQAVVDAVDRLGAKIRRKLDAAEEGTEAAGAVGDAVTTSLEAYRAYFDGLRCREQDTGEDCLAHFEQATLLDPTFALAQYELAVGMFFGPDFAGRGAPALRQALRHIDRAPPKEQLKIRAFSAWSEGREAEAARLYREAADANPDDPSLLAGAGDFFLSRDEPEAALPFLRRAVELAWPKHLELADALGALGRAGELRALVAELEAMPPGARALSTLSIAHAFLGDRRGAIEAARRAIDAAATPQQREDARANLWIMQIWTGATGVEAEIRRACDLEATYDLFTMLAVQGRRAEALDAWERGRRPECPAGTAGDARWLDDSLFWHTATARFAAGSGDVDRVWRHARRAAERNPALGPHLAVYLAYAGDLAQAEELARGLDPDSPRRRGYDAVVLWRQGRREEARHLLQELVAINPWSTVPHVLPPSFLYGELAAEMGDDAAAVEALERFRSLYFYRLDFWSWAYPKSLYLLARSYDRLGRAGEARAAIAQLLSLWKDADADLPLLAEARALGARWLGRDASP